MLSLSWYLFEKYLVCELLALSSFNSRQHMILEMNSRGIKLMCLNGYFLWLPRSFLGYKNMRLVQDAYQVPIGGLIKPLFS